MNKISVYSVFIRVRIAAFLNSYVEVDAIVIPERQEKSIKSVISLKKFLIKYQIDMIGCSVERLGARQQGKKGGVKSGKNLHSGRKKVSYSVSLQRSMKMDKPPRHEATKIFILFHHGDTEILFLFTQRETTMGKITLMLNKQQGEG